MIAAVYYGKLDGIARLKPNQFLLKDERKNYTSPIRNCNWKAKMGDRMRIRSFCSEDVNVSRCDWVIRCFFLSWGGPRDNKSGLQPVTKKKYETLKSDSWQCWGADIKLSGKVFQIIYVSSLWRLLCFSKFYILTIFQIHLHFPPHPWYLSTFL